MSSIKNARELAKRVSSKKNVREEAINVRLVIDRKPCKTNESTNDWFFSSSISMKLPYLLSFWMKCGHAHIRCSRVVYVISWSDQIFNWLERNVSAKLGFWVLFSAKHVIFGGELMKKIKYIEFPVDRIFLNHI